MDDFSATFTRELILGWITENGWPMGQVMNSFRVAVIGVGKGPDMFDICEVIGRDETLRRIDRAMRLLSQGNY